MQDLKAENELHDQVDELVHRHELADATSLLAPKQAPIKNEMTRAQILAKRKADKKAKKSGAPVSDKSLAKTDRREVLVTAGDRNSRHSHRAYITTRQAQRYQF